MNRYLIYLLLFFSILSTQLVVGSEKNQSKLNFIIFIADDVSWDDFACYGNKDVKTPNIDKLAKNGIKFTNAYLTISSCSPSRNSIITSRYPHNTGAAELHTHPPDDMIALPEVLQKLGYHTIASGKFHMGDNAKKGFDIEESKRENIGPSGAEMWVPLTKERPKDKPFFAWFASRDAHRPWEDNKFKGTHKADNITPPHYYPNTNAVRKDFAAYYDEIFQFDYNIGQTIEVLKEQDIFDNTLIIVMADNGRPFPHSKTRVNDRGVKTPFVIHGGAHLGMKNIYCEALVSVIDIAPTIIELAGGKPPESMQGVNFSKLLDNPTLDFRNYIFAEHNWHGFEAHERMVRSRDFMYILNSRPQLNAVGASDTNRNITAKDMRRLYAEKKLKGYQNDVFIAPRPIEELYDLSKDPHQFNNVASNPEYSMQLNQLNKTLMQWMKDTGDSIPENLTPDQYARTFDGPSQKVKNVKRGEMPGACNNATKINHKGVF